MVTIRNFYLFQSKPVLLFSQNIVKGRFLKHKLHLRFNEAESWPTFVGQDWEGWVKGRFLKHKLHLRFNEAESWPTFVGQDWEGWVKSNFLPQWWIVKLFFSLSH